MLAGFKSPDIGLHYCPWHRKVDKALLQAMLLQTKAKVIVFSKRMDAE
jgi:hypothetical protein